jgi:hypothetical protein
MTCVNTEIPNGYYWVDLDGDWELLRYNGKWYTTDEISNFSICELVQDCVVIPVTKPLSI